MEERVDAMWSFLSNRALLTLIDGGWHAERSVGIDDDVRLLKDRGYAVDETTGEILQRFHGLHLIPPEGGMSEASIDVSQAIARFDGALKEDVERAAGEPICPIGTAGLFVLFALPSGMCVFFAQGPRVLVFVRSFAEAIELICDCNRLPVRAEQF